MTMLMIIYTRVFCNDCHHACSQGCPEFLLFHMVSTTFSPYSRFNMMSQLVSLAKLFPLFIGSLWISYNIFCSQSSPQVFPHLGFPLLSISILFFLKNNYLSSMCAAHIIMVVWASLEGKVWTLKENWLSWYQQLSTANSFLSGGRNFMPTSAFCDVFVRHRHTLCMLS